MIKYLIIILALIHFSKTIRFISSNNGSNMGSVISLRLTNKSPRIDVFSGEQIVVVKDVKTYSYTIIILCFLSGYHSNSKIVYSFCKEDSHCIIIKDGEVIKMKDFFNMKIDVDTSFPNKGMKINLYFPVDTIDSSGNYYCEVNDEFGNFMIRSNNIQIRDRYFWERNLVLNNDDVKIDNIPALTRDKTPVTYPCLNKPLNINQIAPKWVNQEFPSPVQWSICPVLNNSPPLKENQKTLFSKCKEFTISKWPDSADGLIRPMDITEMKQWTYYVNDKGDLNIFDIKFEASSSKVSYALMCYTKKMISSLLPLTTISISMFNYIEDQITSGVVFNATLENFNKPLKPLSPILQYVNIYQRKFAPGDKAVPVSIFAKYSASSKTVTKWLFNGDSLNSDSLVTADKFKVNFIRDINSNMAGNYTLTVTDGTDSISISIIVSVFGPPIIINTGCMPVLKYVWENEGTSFTCSYKNRPEELKIFINKQLINLNDSLSTSQSNLAKSYDYLKFLKFAVSPTSYVTSETVSMTYNVFNLQRSQGQEIYQDHMIMFFVQNQYGLSVKSSAIYTVPRLKPLIIISPRLSNCTDGCNSSLTHSFQCKINLKPYENKELTIIQYWSINGHKLEKPWHKDNKFAPYFSVDPISKNLTMYPIISNDTNRDYFVINALLDNFIECHFDLFGWSENTPKFEYCSTDDKSLGTILQAKINLNYRKQLIVTANIYWITAVIIALVILFILIILLIFYCRRNKGRSYPMHKIERESGLDFDVMVAEGVVITQDKEECKTGEKTKGRRLLLSQYSSSEDPEELIDPNSQLLT